MAGKYEEIGAKLVLDGEADYKRALREINAEQKANRAEMALLTEQYQDNAESEAALTAKGKALETQMEAQRKKVATLAGALDNAAKVYGETHTVTQSYRTQLAYAQAELIKLEKAQSQVNQSMEEGARQGVSLAGAVKGLAGAAGIDVPPALQGMVDGLEGVSVSGAALTAVLAGIVAGLAGLTIETAKAADEILTMSSTTGIAAETLQELKYAEEFVDVSTERIADSMKDLKKNMGEVQKGAADQTQAFERLGVRITDNSGQLRDANEVFYETIDALGNIQNRTERDIIAMKLMGEGAKDLSPLIEQGSGKLRELADEAHQMGYVMSEETLNSFVGLSDAMEKFEKQGEALENSFAVALLPILTKFFEVISGIPIPVLQAIIVIAGIVTTIVTLINGFKKARTAGKEFVDFVLKGATSISDALGDSRWRKVIITILAVTAALAALAAVIFIIKNNADSIRGFIKQIYRPNASTFSTTFASNYANGVKNLPAFAKGGTLRSGTGLVGEEGPELLSILPGGGARITPISPRGRSAAVSGGDVYNITIDAKNVKEFNDVVKAAQNARQYRRAK